MADKKKRSEILFPRKADDGAQNYVRGETGVPRDSAPGSEGIPYSQLPEKDRKKAAEMVGKASAGAYISAVRRRYEDRSTSKVRGAQ